jgi:hypothetical protein
MVQPDTAQSDTAPPGAVQADTVPVDTAQVEVLMPEEEILVETLGELEAGGSYADTGGGETIPRELLRPRRGESPRYPRDSIIGALGRGEASEEAYRYARELLEAILRKSEDSPYLANLDAALKETVFTGLEGVEPRKFRIGGGREEADGATSFLFRFIGREWGLTGELYLRQEEEAWRLDDIIMEEPREMGGREDTYQYDFSPYERFF